MKAIPSQVKINLSLQLKDFAQSKASKFGLPLAGYIRHLIIKDVEDMDFPTYAPSEETIRAYNKSKEEERKGQLIVVDDLDEYFKNL